VITPGETILFHSTNTRYEVLEVGVLRLGLEPRDELISGDVGYVIANVKVVADAKVGDTILSADDPSPQPLPGYRPVKPMVFSGLYPMEAESYESLKESLARLQLNDASLTYEPETSLALGFGFRCGFLGLLHMEIVQERLTREHNVNLIATVPSVEYPRAQDGRRGDDRREPRAHAADAADRVDRRAVRARGGRGAHRIRREHHEARPGPPRHLRRHGVPQRAAGPSHVRASARGDRPRLSTTS
jgi:GTP-binding protein LepA